MQYVSKTTAVISNFSLQFSSHQWLPKTAVQLAAVVTYSDRTLGIRRTLSSPSHWRGKGKWFI